MSLGFLDLVLEDAYCFLFLYVDLCDLGQRRRVGRWEETCLENLLLSSLYGNLHRDLEDDGGRRKDTITRLERQ